MILLRKKRLMIIIGTICISTLSYLMGFKYINNTVETVSLPVSGKTVVLDAGHGRRRPRSRI